MRPDRAKRNRAGRRTSVAISAGMLAVSLALSASPDPSNLYTFTGGLSYNSGDGASPLGGLVDGKNGALYGTTSAGGGSYGGTVFALTPPATSGGPWTESILYNFSLPGSGDASLPVWGLITSQNGTLYGTTMFGGPTSGCLGNGCGTVFSLTPPATLGGAWTENVLYGFAGGSDGESPTASVIFGPNGTLYGATYGGGGTGCAAALNVGCGTVFVLIPPAIFGGAWTENLIYSFSGGTDGGNPYSSLILGPNYTLYGTTIYGGASNNGTVFALTPPATSGGAWGESVLHAFKRTGTGDGAAPYAALLLAKDGALYGTTEAGGAVGIGTIYKLKPPASLGGVWTEGLISLAGVPDAANSYAGLFAKNGTLYGTTFSGGVSNAGTVFEVTP